MTKSQALHKLIIVISLLFILLITFQIQALPFHHNIQVELHPSLKMLKASDTITFATDTPRKISFILHGNLQIEVTSTDDQLTLIHTASKSEPYAEYGLTLGSVDNKVSLTYHGVIYDPVIDNHSNGLITPDGATLFGSTYWYPFFLNADLNFDITVYSPANWHSIVQGQLVSTQIKDQTRITRFNEIYPQEEIYLIAAPFYVYEAESKSGKNIKVLLRKSEPALAENFITLTSEYLDHYSQLIAPYPYSSFTIVENFWETGYGMPAFTLLGPSILRMPFLLNSSLPHEILHNWWGNSVYIDFENGNWSEGLTTFMADYWQQEKIGNGREYRLTALSTYSDFLTANPSKDFPLRKFREKRNQVSEAIGYNKSMMFFHMLKNKFGEETFTKALQHFYQENQFRKASFADIQNSFEKQTNEDLTGFFNQWLDFTGAPRIELPDVKMMKWLDESFSTTYTLKQNQKIIYALDIPVSWELESGEKIAQIAHLTEPSQVFSLVTQSRPVKISVDSNFDVFRTLYTEERPSTLSAIFGDDIVNFYFAKNDSQAESFSKIWSKSIEGKILVNTLNGKLEPAKKGALVFLGSSEQFSAFMKTQLQNQKFDINGEAVTINDQKYPLDESNIVIVSRVASNPEQTVVWIRWNRKVNVEQWASRLTHYGNYGVLVFKEGSAVLKTSWPILESPLQRKLNYSDKNTGQ